MSTSAKLKKKSKSETQPPAIIAIQIVDPNENSTSSKNSKRTIDSSLGYGYQNNILGSSKPRYEVYKYSQHDIPAYQSDTARPALDHPKVQVQKSIQYRLPTVTEYQKDGSDQIQPGTTLFSTINAKGQVGDLSSSLPQSSITYDDRPVPVIILRIYPQQLKDSSLFANLPRSHPFASRINNVDLQALLAQYLKQLQNQISRGTAFRQPQPQYYASENQPERQQQYHQPAYYEHPSRYYTSDQRYQQYDQQDEQQYDRQQQYDESNYDQQYYDRQQQQHYQQQRYRDGSENQYSEYPQTQYEVPSSYYDPQYQDPQKPEDLLTHENYPSGKHTKVIFKTKKGEIKVSNTEDPPTNEVKTIKIHVPDNVADVQVEETEKAFPGNDDLRQYVQRDEPVYYSSNYVTQQPQYQQQEDVSQLEAVRDGTLKSYKRGSVINPHLINGGGYYYYQSNEDSQESGNGTPVSEENKETSTVSSYPSRRLKLKRKRLST
ncbi:GATA zinc finger domain-containing protein 10 isoform X2 [Cylas formicarius]|uniref:GATA zinc finger domain-containing protein 10 isoform X2 n=2 Tax=Cylas formicarius TaxID=197179 RepID=UPI002958C301|nr:GATA zinc finger domain-containing protein 10 isoform X2 [Cylas formicarius]